MRVKFAPGRFLVIWIVFFAVYLLLTLEWQGAELVAGTLCAALVSSLLLAVRRQSRVEFPMRPGWFWLLARRLPGKVLADCALLLRALGAVRPPGAFRAVPFDRASGTAPDEAAARRALVIAGVSLPPNSVVVTVDRERNRLLVHQLVDTPAPPGEGDRLWPL